MSLTFANKVTVGRILIVPFFIATVMYISVLHCYFRWIALGLFLVAVISDVIDGYIARTRGQKTKAGAILDPLADKMLLISAFICLYIKRGCFPDIHFPLWFVVAIISRDIILLLGSMIIQLTTGKLEIEANRSGKLTAFLQIVCVLGVLLQLTFTQVFWYVALVATFISGIIYIMEGIKALNEPTISLAISALFAYLIGSIPVAYIFGRLLKGIDIREHGSGNMGATNAFRVLGKVPGTLVLILDIIKGIIPVTILANAFGLNDAWSLVVIAVAAVVGHNWTVFLGFKGGKGMATSLGVLIGLAIQFQVLRIILLWVTMTWLALFLLIGFVSLASIIAAVVFPVLMVAFLEPLPLILMSIILCVFIVFRHRSNIKRLAKGQESRVSFPFRKRP